ncbi:MAG: 30S ribosomal protein S20 [Sumerlaeia bacterium]
MPNKKSAEKRVRQNERRRIRNKAKKSTLRRSIRDVRIAIDKNETEGITTKLSVAQSNLGKAAKTNLIKKNNASRRISRLAKAVNKVQQPPA